MKCQYCGNNLGIEEEICPYCGKANSQAMKHILDMKQFKADYEETKQTVIKESRKFNERTARVMVLAIMVLIVAIMLLVAKYYEDFESRQERAATKQAEAIEKNKDEMAKTLKEMEEHREYLALYYYELNHGISHNEYFRDYTRVFTAATDYEVIYSDILSIVDGNSGYGQKTKLDWCKDIAIYISQWNLYVEGEFWNDSPTSSMHTGEHGAFIADCKKEIQDMVQVYFKLTDEQSEAMWTMDEENIGNMLYEKCMDLYPEEAANE